MKNFLITILALMTFTSIYADPTVNRYELNVNDFTSLKVIDGLNVDYKFSQDSAGKAVFETTPDLASVLMLTNRKGKLEMQISTDGIDYVNLPTITVYSRFLSSVENSGDSTVRVLQVAACPEFKALVIGNGTLIARNVNASMVKGKILTGNGQMVLYGECESARLSVTGTGSIQADELESKEAKCSIIGTGTIGCNTSGILSISGAGTGKVYYTGHPSEIKTHIGGIKAVPLGD